MTLGFGLVKVCLGVLNMETEKGLKENTRCASWKLYLKELVETFRTEYDKLGEDGKARVPYNLYFNEPCQIEVIEFAEPYYQILLIIHDAKRRDKEFLIHECGKLNKLTYSSCIQRKVLSNKKWDKEVIAISGKRRNLKDLLEDVFVTAFKWFEKQVFINYDKPQVFKNGNAISENIGVWFVKGDFLSLNPLGIVLEVCKGSPYKYYIPVDKRHELVAKGKDAKKGFVYVNHIGNYTYIETHEEYKELERYRVTSFKEIDKNFKKITETRVNGFGAYIFPPVWVDEIPKASFQQRILSGLDILFHQKAVEGNYNKSIFIVTKDGFVALGIHDKYKALRELNTIMASAIISEIPMLSVKDFEVGEVTIDIQKSEISSFSMELGSLRNILGSSVYTQPSLVHDRKIISSKIVVNIIETAEKISKDEKLQSLCLFLLESYTHLVNMELSSAFLLSWYVIETWLMEKWDSLLNDKSITGERREKLRSHLLYKTTDRVIETLNLMSKISNEEYSQLMKFKDTRNGIVHRGIIPSKDRVDECFNYAHKIIKNYV